MIDDPQNGWNEQSEPFLVADFEVNPSTHSIKKDGLSIKLEPRAMALLLYLAQQPGTVVSREELEQEVWKGLVVGYDALNNTIAKLRKAFDDDPKNPRIIHTVPKKGYRLIAEVGVSPALMANDPIMPHKEPDPSLQRKLTAILYTDAVDYSRLTGLDEDGTHRRLSSCLDLMTGYIERYHGSVVHFAGDAILAEFNTASNALSCAATIQQELATQNADETDARKMQFRIGVNLGEVIVDRNDIYGDGVNVAARLEALAEPGGICLSGAVFDAIGHQLPLDYSFLGERHVKNIDKPVRAYQARLKRGMTLAPPHAMANDEPAFKRSNKSLWVAFLSVLFVVMVSLLVWLQPWRDRSVNTDELVLIQQESKPTIAVLPFENVSDDPAQEFYADGMTSDLITDLSKVSGLAVIARHSVFAYKDQTLKLDQIGRELRAGYVLEGSVRRFDQKIRINVSLIDVATRQSMWSERYDGDESELFDLHNRVVGSIVSILAIELTDREQTLIVKTPTKNLEAYDYYLRAEKRSLSTRNKAGWVADALEAINLYWKAIALDPEFAEAYVGLAVLGLYIWMDDETSVMPGATAKKLSYDSISKVHQLDPQNPAAHAVLAMLQAADGQHEVALKSSQQAIDLSPNSPDAWAARADVLIYAGQPEAALEAITRALELNPKPPEHYYGLRGRASYFTRQYEEAASFLSKVHWSRNIKLMTYGQLGRTQEAAALLDEMAPFLNLGWYRTKYAHYKRKQDVEHIIDGLRKAGVPDNAFGFEGSPQHRLDARTLKKLALGRTWTGVDGYGTGFTQEISNDGRTAFRNDSTLLVGTAWLEHDLFCVNFLSNLKGRNDCGYVYRNPGGRRDRQNEYVRVAAGSIYYFIVDE